LTFEDLDGNFIKIYQDLYVHDQFLIEQNTAIQATGTLIDFEVRKIFNTSLIPAVGNFTPNLTNAKLGVIQKIYHQDSSVPTFPAGWVLMDGVYMINSLNIIYAEFSESTRVEYRIVNAATNGIRISVTPISNGNNNSILFQTANQVKQDVNFVYDASTARFGIGTETPGAKLDVRAQGALSTDLAFRIRNSVNTVDILKIAGNGNLSYNAQGAGITLLNNDGTTDIGSTGGSVTRVNLLTSPAKIYVNYTTSIRTFFESQASGTSGETAYKFNASIGSNSGTTYGKVINILDARPDFGNRANTAVGLLIQKDATNTNTLLNFQALSATSGNVGFGVLINNASAKVQIDSTTQGLLVPRMTTTEKNAIATPAAGLQVYDTTTNKLCCFNGTSWFDLF
jgi:hypothetical protein